MTSLLSQLMAAGNFCVSFFITGSSGLTDDDRYISSSTPLTHSMSLSSFPYLNL
jgi:hypothetical protein